MFLLRSPDAGDLNLYPDSPMKPTIFADSPYFSLRRAAFLLLFVVCMSLLFVGRANASPNQLSLFQDDGRLTSYSAEWRADALDKMQAMGVDVVKVTVHWRESSPHFTSSNRPSGDGASTSYYNWGISPTVVEEIRARGMTPWLMLTQVGPDWASSGAATKSLPGGYKPDPAAFGEFAVAAFKRFSDVPYVQIGNEPNFQYWLWPQITKKKVSFAAVHYRKMYIEAQDRILAEGLAGRQLLFGALAPRANAPTDGQRATQPVRFLRDFFCLDDKLKRLKGAAARSRSCTGKYKQIRATGFAYHPYTTKNGPQERAKFADDAPIAYMKRIYKVLDKAYSYKRLSVRRIPVWNDEFAYESNPPDIIRTPVARIPQYINEAEYLSYRDPRLRSYAQYQLYDEPLDFKLPASDLKHYSGFQAGLYFVDGSPKGALPDAYRVPLVAMRTGKSNTVKIWFGLRNLNTISTPLAEIQFRKNAASPWNTVATALSFNRGRYAEFNVTATGASKGQFRVISGKLESRTAKAAKAPTTLR